MHKNLWFGVGLILILFCVFEAKSQQPDFILQKGKHKYQIPFEYKNDFIIVNIYFNDVFPLRFIFDTGAEHTILVKREVADLFQVDYTRKFTLYGADLSSPLYAYLAPGITLSTNKVKALNRSILVLDEDYLNFQELTGLNIHGILGADFFRRFIVKIDYRKQRITLYDPVHFAKPQKKYREIPIEIRANKPYINTDISINREDHVKAKLLLDTGASLALMLYTNTHPDLTIPNKVLKTEIGVGLGGYIEGLVGRVEAFEIADLKLQNVVTNYQELLTRIDSVNLNNRNGLLGNQVLKRFDVIIDYVDNRLYLNPNKAYKKKFNHDKSGLILAAGGDNLNQYTTLKVINRTPAQRAGILKGDQILSINGWPTSLLSLEGINNKLKSRVGKTIRLKILRVIKS